LCISFPNVASEIQNDEVFCISEWRAGNIRYTNTSVSSDRTIQGEFSLYRKTKVSTFYYKTQCCILRSMIQTKQFRDCVWVDAYNPTQDEVKEILSEYTLDADVVEELLSPSLKPRIERHSEYLYLILHFPAFKQSYSRDNAQEIDIIVGKDFLITTRYDSNESIERFSKHLEVESVTKKAEIAEPAFFLFFALMDHLYTGSQFEIDNQQDRLKYIESKIYEGAEKEMVFTISELSRDVLSFKQIISPHKEILKNLASDWKILFKDAHKHDVERLIANYFRIKNNLYGVIDTMHELRLTNDSLLSTKQNETMKIFTILAFVTFPLTLIAGVFGMNTAFTPFVGIKNDFFIIIAIMIALTLVMFLFFKLKKWL